MEIGTVLAVPRGIPGLAPLKLDMSTVYEAEQRVSETGSTSVENATQLAGYFNQACNTVGKYLAWVEYEINQAKKQFGLAKATVILEKAPEEWKKLSGIQGMKYNEDFREAVVARDPECQQWQDVVAALEASKKLLEGKFWTFVRAFNSCEARTEHRGIKAAQPVLNGFEGQTLDPNNNFMGATRKGSSGY